MDALLKEFKDVFFEALPLGLPPDRGVAYRIELVPRAMSSANRSYKMSPEELDELRKELDELLE